MELQSIPKQINKKLAHQVFQTIEAGTKNDNKNNKFKKELIDIKYNVDILESFASPKKTLPTKILTRPRRNMTIKKKGINNLNNILLHKNSTSLLKNYHMKNNENSNESFINNNNKNNYNTLNINNNSLTSNRKKIVKFNETTNNNNDEAIFITKMGINSDDENDGNKKKDRYSDYIRNTEINRNKYNKNNVLKKYSLPPINKNSISYNFKNNQNNNLITNILNNEDSSQNSNLNNIIKEDNKTIDYEDKEKNNKTSSKYLRTESPYNDRNKNNILKINESLIYNMIKNNKKISNNIHKGKNLLEVSNLDLETKFKYLNWKYGIAEMDKYFIDINSYKKTEEDELNNKKLFYDRLEEIIYKIKNRKKNQNIENIAQQFGVKLNLNEEEDTNKQEINEFDKMFFKSKDCHNSIKKLLQRQKDEKIKRDKVDDILIRCRIGFNKINSKLDKYKNKDKKLKEII